MVFNQVFQLTNPNVCQYSWFHTSATYCFFLLCWNLRIEQQKTNKFSLSTQNSKSLHTNLDLNPPKSSDPQKPSVVCPKSNPFHLENKLIKSKWPSHYQKNGKTESRALALICIIISEQLP